MTLVLEESSSSRLCVSCAADNEQKNEKALEEKAAMIKKENAKFARKFSTPHTSMYTGVHESIDKILDPK